MRLVISSDAVSDFGEVLELMHGAVRRYRTLVGEVRIWQDSPRKREAVLRFIDAGGSVATPTPQEYETIAEVVSKVTVALPDRFREERTVIFGRTNYAELVSTVVVDGLQWWIQTPQGSFTACGHPNGGTYTRTRVSELLDPRDVAVALDLELAGTARVAGRSGTRLRGTPRPADAIPSPSQGFDLWNRGATGFEVVVDNEYGVLLRTAASATGQEIDVMELVTVSFDAESPPEAFTFIPPEGDDVRPLPDPRPMTMDDCRSLSAFTAFLPPFFSDVKHVSWQDPWERDAKPVLFMRRYMERANREGGSRFIDVEQSRASAQVMVGAGYEEVVVGTTKAYAWREESSSYCCLAFVQSGTEIRLRGPVEVTELAAFASLLRPAFEAST